MSIPARAAGSQVPEVDAMGEVVAVIKIMPEGADVDMSKIMEGVKTAIPSYARLHGMQVMDIAFGLKALKIAVILGDKSGGTEEIEANLAKIPQVESVEVEEVGLL
jgi:elongation factor 1-beta